MTSHNPTCASILNIISAKYTIKILKVIGSPKTGKYDSRSIINKTKITPKQCYSRISKLKKTGLVRKTKEGYHLTTLGNLVLDAIILIENSIAIYHKLKAIDAVDLSDQSTREEIIKLIDALITNDKIKEIVKRYLTIRSRHYRRDDLFQ